ncbi:MAG: hypothetical protein JWQ34_1442 [Mucilaginibacter sp.]|uniref:DUF3667 domain-containing protein n=1 Tax=Mucilaginibacter sp. TaxID=1882438 RepID=UPI00261DDA88|nr:DUF3667 domain-containing protein [Mucilaginibacter sp.]MDB5003217.1 hypothetical protein [Mucilaginibacter sp.]
MTCTNCGHTLEENFCTYCGEKRFDKKQLSFKHFLEETFEGLVHFDNKFFSTLKLLFTKPGQLSLDYVEGRRTRHMKPVPFFLVINLLFFLLVMGNVYSLHLYNYTHFTPFTWFNTAHIVQQKIALLGISLDNYSYIFEEKMHAASKVYIFVFIPMYAFICWLLFISYKRLVVEHLVFATHFVSFILCWFFLHDYLFNIPYYYIINFNAASSEVVNYSPIFDTVIGVISMLVIAAYFAISARRFYKARLISSITSATVVGVSFVILITVYRMLLFFKILYL